jgi:hypothetical protein
MEVSHVRSDYQPLLKYGRWLEPRLVRTGARALANTSGGSALTRARVLAFDKNPDSGLVDHDIEKTPRF